MSVKHTQAFPVQDNSQTQLWLPGFATYAKTTPGNFRILLTLFDLTLPGQGKVVCPSCECITPKVEDLSGLLMFPSP